MKLILGLGITGLSIARFLSSQSIAYKIADSRARALLDAYHQNSIWQIGLEVEPQLGQWSQDLLTGVDEVFISPGIAQTETIVGWARAQNIPITSDIELFSRFAKAPIIGITGSNGKSTVTQLLGDMIAHCGENVAVGGNIGTPALDCLNDLVDYYVLELSSYQLDYVRSLNLVAGVVLNVAPDHLERYENFEAYIASKLSIHQYCQNVAINLDAKHIPPYKAENTHNFGVDIPKRERDFGTVTCHGTCFLLKGDDVLMSVDEMQLIGDHNITNILAALALGTQIGLSTERMIECIKDFKGLAHRLEWVAKIANVDYYNDSKATNVTATITALKALVDKHRSIVLIAGGVAKSEDYAPLLAFVDTCVAHIVLIGKSAQMLGDGVHKTQAHYADSMTHAVELASGLVDCGVVLLSPACASFDMFADFKARGEAFKHQVLQQIPRTEI